MAGFVSGFSVQSLRARTGLSTAVPRRSQATRYGRARSAVHMSQAQPAVPAEAWTEKKEKKSIGGPIGVLWAVVVALWALVLYFPMALIHPLVKWADGSRRRVHDWISRWFFKFPMYATGFVPEFRNKENLPPADEAVVYVANHSSFFDIFIFGFMNLHHKFVSKIEILRIPIVGWAMQMKGDIALRRGNRKSQLQTYRDMLSNLRNGNSLVIFPEGTRSETGKMRKFQSGAFKAARATEKRIVPFTILGTREAFPPSTLLPLRRHRIVVEVHPAIDPKDMSEDELSDAARRAIQSALPEDLRDEPVAIEASSAVEMPKDMDTSPASDMASASEPTAE